MRKPPHHDEVFDRLVRGEISRVEAYESSLEGIKDSLLKRQYAPGFGSEHTGEERDRSDSVTNHLVSDNGDEFSSHNPEAVYHLMELIADIRTAMLTTIDMDGTLRSRPMLTQKTEDDGTLWFFSSDHHGKADELSRDPRVNVTYSMPDKNQFISISGLAELVHDEAKKRELWSASLKTWFPEGANDSHLALLKVYIQKAEYWDVPSNRLVEMLSFTKAVLTGGVYHTAEPHQKIRFELGL